MVHCSFISHYGWYDIGAYIIIILLMYRALRKCFTVTSTRQVKKAKSCQSSLIELYKTIYIYFPASLAVVTFSCISEILSMLCYLWCE